MANQDQDQDLFMESNAAFDAVLDAIPFDEELLEDESEFNENQIDPAHDYENLGNVLANISNNEDVTQKNIETHALMLKIFPSQNTELTVDGNEAIQHEAVKQFQYLDSLPSDQAEIAAYELMGRIPDQDYLNLIDHIRSKNK